MSQVQRNTVRLMGLFEEEIVQAAVKGRAIRIDDKYVFDDGALTGPIVTMTVKFVDSMSIVHFKTTGKQLPDIFHCHAILMEAFPGLSKEASFLMVGGHLNRNSRNELFIGLRDQGDFSLVMSLWPELLDDVGDTIQTVTPSVIMERPVQQLRVEDIHIVSGLLHNMKS